MKVTLTCTVVSTQVFLLCMIIVILIFNNNLSFYPLTLTDKKTLLFFLSKSTSVNG